MPSADTTALVAIRQDEQRAASRALGGDGDVVFLGYPDGELESGLDAARRRCLLDPIAQAGRGLWT